MRRWKCPSLPIGVVMFYWYMINICSLVGLCYASSSLVHVVVGSSSTLKPPKYPGQVARFGNQKPKNTFINNVNLILPKNNETHLCGYPFRTPPPNPAVEEKETTTQPSLTSSSFRNSTTITGENGYYSYNNISNEYTMMMMGESNNNATTTTATETTVPSSERHFMSRENQSVALFVSYGECLPFRKAETALLLRSSRNFTKYGTVTHLIIYNNDYSNMDELHTLTSYIDSTDIGDLNDITVIFISTRSGHDIMESLKEEQKRQRIASPFFTDDGNEMWYMPVAFLEPPPWEIPNSHHNHNTDGVYGGGGSGGSSSSSYNGGFDPDDPNNDNFGGSSSNNEPIHHFPPPQTTTTKGGIPEDDEFYWFRLIVFSLLVVSPCFRAGYLWYAGGARIRLRYNEQGRIIGLQYIPPMPYWFAPRPGDENENNPATRITREQVLALPEIVYTGAPPDPDAAASASSSAEFLETENNNNTTTKESVEGSNPNSNESTSDDKIELNNHTDNDSPSVTASSSTGPINTSSSSEGEDLASSSSLTGAVGSSATASASLNSSSDIGQPTPTPPADNPTTTIANTTASATTTVPTQMQSTCSICIDDFEPGERLRMLPRCGHIFHTDCILPWLTERQGCCPLCKTEVIEPENEEGGGVSDGNTSNINNNDNHRTVPSASASSATNPAMTGLPQSSLDYSSDIFDNEGRSRRPQQQRASSSNDGDVDQHRQPQQATPGGIESQLSANSADVFSNEDNQKARHSLTGHTGDRDSDNDNNEHSHRQQQELNSQEPPLSFLHTEIWEQNNNQSLEVTRTNGPEIAPLPESTNRVDSPFQNEYDQIEEGRKR